MKTSLMQQCNNATLQQCNKIHSKRKCDKIQLKVVKWRYGKKVFSKNLTALILVFQIFFVTLHHK